MKKIDWGIVLFDSIFIGEWEIPSWVLLTLRLEQGEAVLYQWSKALTIDYPGQYELSGYNIVAVVAPKSTKLNYIIRFANSKIAYIQDVKSLDDDDISDMDTWYVTHAELKDVIERRELWGDVQILE